MKNFSFWAIILCLRQIDEDPKFDENPKKYFYLSKAYIKTCPAPA